MEVLAGVSLNPYSNDVSKEDEVVIGVRGGLLVVFLVVVVRGGPLVGVFVVSVVP